MEKKLRRGARIWLNVLTCSCLCQELYSDDIENSFCNAKFGISGLITKAYDLHQVQIIIYQKDRKTRCSIVRAGI